MWHGCTRCILKQSLKNKKRDSNWKKTPTNPTNYFKYLIIFEGKRTIYVGGFQMSLSNVIPWAWGPCLWWNKHFVTLVFKAPVLVVFVKARCRVCVMEGWITVEGHILLTVLFFSFSWISFNGGKYQTTSVISKQVCSTWNCKSF